SMSPLVVPCPFIVMGDPHLPAEFHLSGEVFKKIIPRALTGTGREIFFLLLVPVDLHVFPVLWLNHQQEGDKQ
ncbi:MAG: hypothetical protein NTW95_03295, partial [Candidatus Aminicenantes bacterium]|nr:hypothetical protein [Candidatus Aminicenantes bacterium]